MSIKTSAYVGCDLVVATAGLENFSEIAHRRIQMFIFLFSTSESHVPGNSAALGAASR